MKRNNFETGWNWFGPGRLANLIVLVLPALFLFLGATDLFAAEHGEGGGINPLNWRTDLAIWTGVVFLGLVLILGKFAFGPIVKALDQREQSMLDQVSAVEKANADARELLNQYQKKLSDSQDEVRQMLENAKADAERTAQGIVAQAKQNADDQRRRALTDIETATDGALEELATRSAELATTLAGKILQEKIDPQQHARLIHGAISQFSGK